MQRPLSPFKSSSAERCAPKKRGTLFPGAPYFQRACALLGAGFAFSASAAAQGAPELTFSIDFSGPTISVPGDPQGNLITDGDLLIRSGGPFSPSSPRISVQAQFLARYMACQNHLPGQTCGLEMNAISFGRDARLRLSPNYRFNVLFSVDEFARGRPVAGASSTSVFEEANGSEASTDIYLSSFTGAGPFSFSGNSGYADGNGQRVQQGAPHVFGLGLVEPTAPNTSTTDTGDNIDAINYGREFDPLTNRLYFSLESDMVRCFEQGPVFNSAANQPLLGMGTSARSSDVLVWSATAGGVALYAAGPELGLDRTGADIDDIDALMVFENGDGIYTPPSVLYDWNSTNGSDLILFSVRCNSDIVGEMDALGRIITEGDILIKLDDGSTLPQVFIPAELLGLRSTSVGDPVSDELNGLDIFDMDEDPFLDCNDNGIDDALDISDMNSDDVDNNGIPDECEDDWSSYCDCRLAVDSPCGNNSAAGRGCLNSSALGGRLEMGGTTSVDSDALVLLGSDLNPGGFAVAVGGLTAGSGLVGNGRICLGSGFARLGGAIPVVSGAVAMGPGLIVANPGTLSVMSGSTHLFQLFYRDSGGPCTMGTTMPQVNMTNAISVLFTP